MDLPPGDIFDTETEDIPENVQADLDRMSYAPRLSEVTTEAGDLVNSDPEQFYSLKLAGDLAYLGRDFSRAAEMYEKYLRASTAETGRS